MCGQKFATEAEWEYIAKNYTKEDKTPINEFNKVCEYQKINLFCDLFSGVWEWTKDNKSKYLKKLQTDGLILYKPYCDNRLPKSYVLKLETEDVCLLELK